MEDKELETLLEQLESWAGSVGRQAAIMIPQVRDTVASDDDSPAGAPSKASMAVLILNQIEKPVSEVTGIMQMIREHLFEHYDKK